MNQVNSKSDFSLILIPVYACAPADARPSFPKHNFSISFYTDSGKSRPFVASCIDGRCNNCIDDNGYIRVIFNSHGLSFGTLHAEITSEIPDPMYPDGLRSVVSPFEPGIQLTSDDTLCCRRLTCAVPLPWLDEYASSDKYIALVNHDQYGQSDLLNAVRFDYVNIANEGMDMQQSRLAIQRRKNNALFLKVKGNGLLYIGTTHSVLVSDTEDNTVEMFPVNFVTSLFSFFRYFLKSGLEDYSSAADAAMSIVSEYYIDKDLKGFSDLLCRINVFAVTDGGCMIDHKFNEAQLGIVIASEDVWDHPMFKWFMSGWETDEFNKRSLTPMGVRSFKTRIAVGDFVGFANKIFPLVEHLPSPGGVI